MSTVIRKTVKCELTPATYTHTTTHTHTHTLDTFLHAFPLVEGR